MTAFPVVLLVTAATALGAYLLLLWFRKARRPVLIGFHVLLGLGAAETLIVFLHTSGLDEESPARRLALVAGGFWPPRSPRLFRAAVRQELPRDAPIRCWPCTWRAASPGFLVVLAFVSRL